MSTTEVEKTAETEIVGATVVAEAWDSIHALSATMGVPTIEELMTQLDEHVLETHGPVPPTPTWEEVVASWTEHQADDVVDAEIVEEPNLVGNASGAGDHAVTISTPAADASAKALPAARVKKNAKPGAQRR